MNKAELIDAIEQMMAAPLPQSHEGLDWFERWRFVLDAINDPRLRLDPEFFQFIHHYVADADLRFKDANYRNAQDAAMKTYLQQYR